MRSNKYTVQRGLRRSRVRSLPALVLPATGGRYSHGMSGLSGCITNQHRLLEPLLSCTSLNNASTEQLYFRALSVNRPELTPKNVLNPRRLCTLLLQGSYDSKLKYEKPKKCRVSVNSRIPSRPKWTRWIALKQGCLSRVLRTHTAIYTCHQVVDFTLMTSALPSERSSSRLAPYWLDAPSLTFGTPIERSALVYEVFTLSPMTAETITLP